MPTKRRIPSLNARSKPRKTYGSYNGNSARLKRDNSRKAKAPGYRKSKSGNWYYEARINRADNPDEKQTKKQKITTHVYDLPVKVSEAESFKAKFRLPTLTGTEKQIAYAKKILSDKINLNQAESWLVMLRNNEKTKGMTNTECKAYEQKFVQMVNKFLSTHTKSGFWIDYKGISINTLIRTK